MTEPTDAEIMLEASKVGGLFDDLAIGYQSEDILKFARAVLARRGQPSGAGEPVAAHRVMRKRLDGEWVCDGRYWCDGPPSKELVESVCSDKDRWRVDVAHATPQPTHAQAGAVTDAQVLAAVRVVSPSLFRHGLQPLSNDGANTAAQMRKEADTVRKMLEAANGIKGGLHGAK